MARINLLITVGAASTNAFRLSDGAIAAVANEALPPCQVEDLEIQMYPGATGVGYIMLGVPVGVVGNPGTVGHLAGIAPIPSGAGNPGTQITFGKWGWGPETGCIDGNKAWVSGSHAGDQIIVSYERID